MEAILNFVHDTGFYLFSVGTNWTCLVMILISFVLFYLAIVKGFEPLLLIPIGFGMLMTNLPGAEMFHEVLFAGGHVQWTLFQGAAVTQDFVSQIAASGTATPQIVAELTALIGQQITPGLLDVLYLGVKLGIYPCLIFMGVGAMTDFGPLIANPKGLIFGAAAQLGIYIAFILALAMGNSAWFTNTLGIDFTANAFKQFCFIRLKIYTALYHHTKVWK